MRVLVGAGELVRRSGVVRLLEELGHEPAGVTHRLEQLPALVAAHRPDVVVLAVRTPPRAVVTGVGLLVLADALDPDDVAAALAGDRPGRGYLLTGRLTDPAALDDALHRVVAGEVVLDPAAATAALARRRQGDPLGVLTAREREILRLMAEGLSNRGIAARLGITANTVGTHVQRVLDKLGLPDTPADNRRVLAVLAHRALTARR